MNGNNGQTNNFNIGKRKINIEGIQQAFQNIMAQSPQTDAMALQQYLIKLETDKLKKYQHIENLGLKPSKTRLKLAINQLLPDEMTFDTFVSKIRKNKNQVLQDMLDETALAQLTNSLNDSQFIVKPDYETHQQVLSQERTYIDVSFSNLKVLETEPKLAKLFQAHQAELQSPASYTYNYIDITPETLGFAAIEEDDIQKFFLQNPQPYQDTSVNYQLTEIASGKGASTTNPFPQYIQDEIDTFTKSLKRFKVVTHDYDQLLSDISSDMQPYINAAIQNQYSFYTHNNRLYIIEVKNSTPSSSISPSKRDQLVNDATFQYHHRLMTSQIKNIEDFAYMHPKNIEDVANEYHITIESTQTQNPLPALLNTLEDSDTLQKRFVSEPIQLAPNHYQLIQISDYKPPHKSSYSEALPKLKEIFKEEILTPEIMAKLSSAATFESINAICKEYGIIAEQKNASIHDMDGMQKTKDLIPTKLNPSPSMAIQAEDGTHWVKLTHISFNDSDIMMEDIIQNMDADLYISQISNT